MNMLPFVLILSVSLLLERFLHAMCFAVFYLMSRTTQSEQSKALASIQVATGAFGSVIGFASATCTVITQMVAVLLQWVVSWVILFLLSCFLYVFFQYATDMMFELGDTYNNGLGASLQIVIVWPVKVLALIFESICPIWNAVIWIIIKLPSQILFQTITYNIGILYNAIESFGLMMNALAMSCVSWVGSFVCCDEPNGFCNPRCFDAGERVFDLLSPLAHMRNLVVWITQWLREMCYVMAGPMDIVTYPFMDINFAKGVHFLFNSVVYLVFHVPAITVERCTKYNDDSPVMCMPDFDPVFNMLVSGFRYMGLFFDNWLDVGLLIVNTALNRPIPECHAVPDLLRDFDFTHNFFGFNETVMVGMTEYMFARTDGLGVQYFSTDRDWQTVLHPEAFPFRVHAGYGIAAISHLKDADHDSKGDDTTGLLGCACKETSIGMQITCGVAMFGDDVAASNRIIQTSFQLPSTGQMMRCNKVMIRVESIRWPVSRFTATKVLRLDGTYAQDVGCTGKGTCMFADAAIWVRPMCSVGYIDPVCIDSFKQAACFPYCMALHVRGSGTQELVLQDAHEWNEGVTLLRRDCGIHNMSADGNSGSSVSVLLPGSVYGIGGEFAAGTTCIQNPLANSRVPKDSMTEYGSHASIDLTDQPFLFAGDVALTAVQGQRGIDNVPRWSIQVHRIFGNQANEFTTIPLNQGIPSLGPCTTPSNCNNINAECKSASGCKAAIPYGYDASVNAHVLGTTTQRYLFWVTNPTLEPFEAFSLHCKNRNTTNTEKLQISVTSSYGGIRLWRINPYLYCPVDPNTGKQQCPEQQGVSTVQVSLMDFNGDFDEKLCYEKLDVMAVDMDYINEDNLALTLLRTTLANVNTNTLRPINVSEAEWVTVWVNPNTMEVREDKLWMPEASSPALTDGTLCPSQRRMPNLGSLAAELASALVFLIRMPLNVILSFPIIMEIAGDQCPIMTRGHSLLKNCGDELLSMEDFFSAIFRSNTLFWQMFAIVADSFGPGAPQTFINGIAIAGENGGWAAMMPGMAKSFSSVGDMDISKASDVISSTVATLPAPVAMARLAMKNPIAYTHFYYRLVTRMLMQILQASQGIRSTGNVFWNVISDGREDFESIVLQRMRRTCGGFAMMAGFSSPLGRLMNHWCIAWVEMQSGMLTLSSVFFVDIPLVDCVCVRSKGKNVPSYIKNYCWAETPDLQKPMISNLISMSDGACDTLVAMTQSHFKEALDPMFSRVEAGIREVGNVLDWFVHANYVGDCNNYADNPYVLALIPQPVDYFRVCGKTNACRLRCFSEFQAFELRNLAPPSKEIITKTVQSLFFNSEDFDTNMPLRPQAMLELQNCSNVCGYVQTVGAYRDRCFLLAGESSAGPMQVISFCAPIQIGSNVRRGGPAWTIENLVPGAFQLGFVFIPDKIEFWKSFKLVVLTQTAVWACHDKCLIMKGLEEFDSDVTRLKRMVILGNLLIVETLYPDGISYFTSKSRIYCMTFSMAGLSKAEKCSTNIWDSNAWPVCAVDPSNTCQSVLLLPRTSSENVLKCKRDKAMMISCDTFQTSRDFVHSASLSGTGIVSQSSLLQGDGSVWNVFMTTPPSQVSHWLLMCKVATLANGAVEGSTGSSMESEMTATVLRPCSIENCVGCTDLGLQRMCYAAQQCQLGRCIGTMVHQKRPLCAIGMNLQAMVAQQLSLVEGAWLMVSETMVAVLAMSGGISPPTAVAWPDQAFYGFICAAKDVSATGISIVMSSINGVVQSLGETPVANANNEKIDNNAKAVFTMTMAATTGFMHQLALAPLYTLMAAQKTFVCSANSIIALASSDKLSVTIGDPSIQSVTESGLGKCMSQYFAENVQGDGSGTDNKQSLLDGAIQAMTNAAMEIQLDVMIHPLDAALTWMHGVVSGLQDVVQNIDRNRCKLPDQSAKDSFRCACNDWSFRIVAPRQADTWQNEGFWCSTTMTMMNYDGKTKYIYNPFSLGELQAMLGVIKPSGLTTLDDYLKCVSQGKKCDEPTSPVFESQQVSLISVYQRCLANYQSRQWDMGTHVLFNTTLQKQIHATIPVPPCDVISNGNCVADCLLLAASQGASNDACLKEWLQKRDIASLDFFEYEKIEPTSTHQVHACQVFSGPALLDTDAGKPFRVCLDHFSDNGTCHLPHIVWSGRSTNKVPVGVDHSTVILDTELKLTAARVEYNSIKHDVQVALNAMADWNASNLQVSIFSAEGDLLHQYFDCLMMGALDDVELWPGPDVAKPIWSRSRSGAKTREFELPCTGEKLKDRSGTRDSKSPFTCGSEQRRSAIKYFLRHGINADNSVNQDIVRVAVQHLMETIRKAWIVDIDNYMCQCPDGTHDIGCCVLDATCDPSTKKCECLDGSIASYACCNIECSDSTFLPASFQVKFTSIHGSTLVDGLLENVWRYLNSTVWTDNRPWLMYDTGGAEAYNWTNDKLQLPVEHGLFDTTSAVSAYDHTELGYPFKTTIWSMCHGLLQQVYFTMPMKDGKPTTLNDPYDPDGVSSTINMTYREDFVRRLVSDAYKQSPLYWHYNARHKPSQSTICERSTPRWPNSVNQTYFAHGYSSMTIGGNKVDCYCGWWHNATHCMVPQSVCERLALLVGSVEAQDVCSNGGFTTNAFLMDAMPLLITLEGGWKGWPCPAMHISDHWGIITDKTAWIKGGRSLADVYQLILNNGTSGLRVGSLDWMMGAHIDHINPAARVESVQQLHCELAPSQMLVDNFVDDLFPAAQGVRQSSAMSVCMRFSIEVARMSAYQEAKLVVASADQSSIVATWRKRCEMKIQQVSFCQVYGVFDVLAQASGCPFTVLSIFEFYSITPSCLIVFNNKVYDPCLCNVEWCTGGEINLNLLGSQCLVYHIRNMVLDKATGTVPWPATSTTQIPRALARSKFMEDILTGDFDVANNKDQWASAEGDNAFQYCDLVVDWWPDSWKHPVGYHVTLPCMGAAHRTFDASWAALRVGSQVSMMHVPNALRNRTMQTNQFGAAGACRTHNYGMPTKIMNTMRFCTQADNRATDPSVPKAAAGTPDWGVEYCTDSPFSVPWTNGPSSVGTHFNYLVDLLPFASWDDKSGHAPFKSCLIDADCCATCKCLMSKAGGICAIIKNGTFECAQHHHCTGSLCAGDGRCVQGVLEILNSAAFSISTRVLSDKCASGAFVVDTWGMSKEDTVPDILNSSGMCSYRSWFEHRRLASCTSTKCTMSGADPWRFSSPMMQPKGAFEAGVLAVLPHSCDRDYEHMDNVYSCSPGANQALLRDPLGLPILSMRGVRTQTYRGEAKTLPIVRHENIDNMAAGFLGVPKTYRELGYDNMGEPAKSNPSLQACSSFGLCGDQASSGMWFVNGKVEPKRMVTTVTGATRNYDSNDMKLCGSMGFHDGTVCRIDPAVAPLFYVFCKSATGASPCNLYPEGKYDPNRIVGQAMAEINKVAGQLNGLFSTMKITPVNTWSGYLTAAEKAQSIWTAIDSQSWLSIAAYAWAKISHKYKDAKPRGLYYLMTYGAYELPFAWWWRCGWLNGLAVTSSATSCNAWDDLEWTPGVTGDVFPNNPTEALAGKTKVSPSQRDPISKLLWLARANGIFTRTAIADARLAAHTAYEAVLASWIIPEISFACYTSATFLNGITNNDYITMKSDVTDNAKVWARQSVEGVCTGFADCLNHNGRTEKIQKNLKGNIIAMLKDATSPCNEQCNCLTGVTPNVCSFAADTVSPDLALDVQYISKEQTYMPLFTMTGGSNEPVTDFAEHNDGCDIVHCCAGAAGCTSQRRVALSTCKCVTEMPLESEMSAVSVTENPSVPPWVIFSNTLPAPVPGTSSEYVVKGSDWVAMDACGTSAKSTRCTLLDANKPECATLTDTKAKTVQDMYCGGTAMYGADTPVSNCVYHKLGAGLECLSGESIAKRYVSKPDVVDVRITNVAAKRCWTLSCSLTMKVFDKKVVFNTAEFISPIVVKVKSRLVKYFYETQTLEWKFGYYDGLWGHGWGVNTNVASHIQKNEVTMTIKRGLGDTMKVLEYTTQPCDYDDKPFRNCEMNLKGTRSLAIMYAYYNPDTVVMSNAGDLSASDAMYIARNIVKNVEDVFSTNTDAAFQASVKGCTDADPLTPSACVNGIYKMNYAMKCTDAEILQVLWKYADEICQAKATHKAWQDSGTYAANKAECYTKLNSDINWVRAVTDVQCWNVEYQASYKSECEATENTACNFSSAYESNLTNAGLPPAGFCPTCIGSSCGGDKSIDTYEQVANTFDLHKFTTQASNKYKLSSLASHFSMSLGQNPVNSRQITCGTPTCEAMQHAVQLYRNMFVCIDCFIVPPNYCTGDHMCSFKRWDWPAASELPGYAEFQDVFTNNNNTYERAHAAVMWAVKAKTLQSFPSPVGMTAGWTDFLEPYSFGGYNPLPLQETFNDNIISLGGYCKNSRILPRFSECQNDLPRRTLRTFVQENYKVPEGSIIPSLHTLTWMVDQDQLMHTNIPVWHAISSDPFFKTLFDDKVCIDGNIANLVCFTNATTTLAMNPVLSGRFEVREGCDTIGVDNSRVLDSQCSALECKATEDLRDSTADEYNTFEGGAPFLIEKNQMRCKARNGATAGWNSVPSSVPVNLCSKRPLQPKTCPTAQGMLGQATWNGNPATSVYNREPWPELVVPSGLLSKINPLLRYELLIEKALGNFTLDKYDIGGHYIRMTLRSTGVLAVSGLPLRSFSDLPQATLMNSTDWIGEWNQYAPTETESMMDQFAMRTCSSWDCPLRRRVFWTAQHPTFRPHSPNPFRTRLMYGTVTHPTTRPAPVPDGLLMKYRTRNGFCVCPEGSACLPASGPCSMQDTILSLTDRQPRPASVLGTPCTQQVDWPWTGGTLRDSSNIPNTVGQCGLLDRLPDFLYRYHNSKTVLDSETTTLDDGGDCHMGRPASHSASATDSCTLLEKTDTLIVMECGGTNVTLQRPKSAVVNVKTRTRCESCDPLPVFKASDGTILNESEVSYGKLWRWAPARKLAQDLRFRLCGNDTSCPAMQSLALEEFWPRMMQGGLTDTATESTVNKLFESVTADTEEPAWAKPWMLCTNNGTGIDCQGTSTKQGWLSDRKGTCDVITKLPNSDQAVADLTVCNLDDNLDLLCRTIQDARYRLFAANCKLSGACRTSAFFYQPATYSMSNDQFVRQTVQYFYNFAVAGSCPAYDAELQGIIAQNQVTSKDCSAQTLEVLQLAIRFARQIVHMFVVVVYYSTQIGLQIVGLISTSDPGPIIQKIMVYLNLILAKFLQFFTILGDLLFKIVMETGQLGKFIQDMVMQICNFLSEVFEKALRPIVCLIKEIIMKILEAFQVSVDWINSICPGGCGFGGFADDIGETRDNLEKQFDCNMPNPFNCTPLFPDNPKGPDHLPMPTRCWMGYKPSVGEQTGLGCSPSDTCMDDDGTLVACAACSGDVDMERYGCDSLTKLCRCHTFPMGQTQCSSHMECQLPNTECGFVDAYLQPSFGNVQCDGCSNQAICLVTGSVGQCTCLLRQTPTQTCQAEYKTQRVSPDPTSLCLVSLGMSISSSSSYSANWLDLSSVSCAMLNGAQTWCLTVWLQNGGFAYMAVGLKLLSGRRLLSIDMSPNLTEWRDAHEPCRSLMLAETELSILERHYASECERWRMIGERAIVMYNLTAQPVQFTSYLGMAEALITPRAYAFLFRHADWAQPLMVLGRRYMHYMIPLINATRILVQRINTIPEAQETIYQVQALMPWFATWKPPDTNETKNESVLVVQNTSSSRRRLLNWKSNLQAVKTYSIQIADGNIANLAPDIAGQWSKGPFMWPPNYNYWDKKQPCLAGSLTWNLTYLTMQSTITYYTKTGPQRPSVARTFQESMPSLQGIAETARAFEPGLVSIVKNMFKSVLGLDMSVIKRYTTSSSNQPSQLSQDVMDLIRCDFDKVQHCTGQHRSLLWGGIIIALMLGIASIVLRTMAIPMGDVFLGIAFVPLTLWFVFGYSVTCIPLVPTCALAEIRDLVETFLPTSIGWPSQLQRWPGCTNGSFPLTPTGAVNYALMAGISPSTAQCFRDCTEWPFQFRTWEDNVQWIACELGFCGTDFITASYQPYVEILPLPSFIYDIVHMDRYVAAAKIKTSYMKWDDMKQSQRICCGFTVFNIVPLVLLSVVILVGALATLALTFALVQTAVNTLVALLTFIHTR